MRGIGVLLFALLGWGCPGERSTCHFWSEEFPCPAGPGRPFAPAPPRLADWTCPAGWLAVPAWEPDEDEEAAGDPAPPRVCEPPPLPEGCPRGTMPVLGERECRPVGVPCPRGDWPRGLPAGQTVLHVRPGAVGGDGSSRDAPLGSLAEAVEAAPDGAVVALAQGIYREAVVLRRPVTLWGACATGTVLLAPSAEEETGTIEVTGRGGVVLRNLGVMGTGRGSWSTSSRSGSRGSWWSGRRSGGSPSRAPA